MNLQGKGIMHDKQIISHLDEKAFSLEDPPTEKPLVVEFNATWSGSCHIMEPVLESLIRKYSHEITFHKVNIEDFPEITKHYGVREVPTFLIFNKGSLFDFAVGAISRKDLSSKLQKVLEAKIKRNF